MRRFLAAFLLLFCCVDIHAQSVTLPAELKVKVGRPIILNPIVDGDFVKWDIDPGLDDFIALLPKAQQDLFGNTRILYGSEEGTFTARCWTAKVVAGKAVPSDVAKITIIVGKGTPVPPPVPPGPKPDPTPVDPPTPAPIPDAGFRVLMIYETATAASLPANQIAALNSQAVRNYLNAKCVVGPDGKTREWRLWDKDVNVSNESTIWQNAMKRPRTAVPWIIISDGKKGFEGPLPVNSAELLKLLKQFGGE